MQEGVAAAELRIFSLQAEVCVRSDTSILHISRSISIICGSLLQKRRTHSLGSFVCAPQLYYLQLYYCQLYHYSQLYCLCVRCLFYLLYLLYLRYFAFLALLAFWARWLVCRVLV